MSNNQEGNINELLQQISEYESTVPNDANLLASAYNNIAIAYAQQSDYDNALLYINKCVQLLETFLPPDHPELRTVKDSRNEMEVEAYLQRNQLSFEQLMDFIKKPD